MNIFVCIKINNGTLCVATKTTAPMCHYIERHESQYLTRTKTAATSGQAPDKPGQGR